MKAIDPRFSSFGTPINLSKLHKKLLEWFDDNSRKLPWRENRDPYRIWVSEVMLQQTTVTAVVPYFKRFIATFPTLCDLAQADEQDVLRLWSGLGYYRRARHLHMAAKKLYLDYSGEIPNDPTVWSQLPGVGRYVLGAVLSQAFDRKLPIVEANSLRVLTRLFGYNRNPHDTPGKKWLWQAAEAILPNKRVGDFNQSLMELGALICTPSLPQCSKCPLAKDCVAYRHGLQHSIPLRKQTQKITEVREVAIVIRQRSKLLLCLRPANADRWQNMWECPHAEVRDGESNETAALRVARELTGLKVRLVREAFFVKYGVTRFTITMACFEAVYNGGTFTSNFYTEGRWVQIDELDNYPVSSPQRKLLVKFG